MTIRAVLFDVGGPLNTELAHERLMDEDITAALTAEGFAVDPEAYAAAWRRAVSSFAPDAYKAVIWHLTGQDKDRSSRAHARVEERASQRDVFELRDGMPALLRRLHERGLLLGLVANQPEATLARLDDLGVGRFFAHRQVSGAHGFRKPDPRAFLDACQELGVEPHECVMVGDRVDNDIAPARLLGMRTVLLRTGRHAGQQPRSWDEMPHAEVHDVEELEAAILSEAVGSGR
jgi:putative hydrolase of the HAD superfamily